MSSLVEGNGAVVTGGASLRPAAKTTALSAAATPQGLYDPLHERDACGVGFIVNLHNRKSHRIIEDGLKIVENLTHRGAVGADPKMGDGAGMLVQIPHKFFLREAERLGFALPEPGQYAVGHIFMPQDAHQRADMERIVAQSIADEGQVLLGWRDVPVDNSELSHAPEIAVTEPYHRQVFIGRGASIADDEDFERKLYIVRKVISARIYAVYTGLKNDFYIVSMSCRTLVYKGMFLAYQLGSYYRDLSDPDFESALALVHQRFSTNTFPSWRLAHPYRFVCHNGEINTVRGNVNWMAARQATASSRLFGNDISKLWPISYEGQSDTACFDNALEFLVRGGYSLPHAAMTLIPEAWAGNPLMDEDRRAFYEYHAALMEPWDGPAAVAFTDGKQIGATLDRNGLRPARYMVTADDEVIMASEAGVLPVEESRIVQKWRLQPGKMLLIDLEQQRIIDDAEIKAQLANAKPYKQWLARTQIVLEDLPPVPVTEARDDVSLLDRQQAFGYTQEDLKLLMTPMAVTGQEGIGSMGNDVPISAMSDKSKVLYTYFKQNFAQVTNPPIDSIREELVMSLVSFIGPRPNLFDTEGQGRRKRLEVRQPILTNEDLEKIRAIGDMDGNPFRSETFDITYPADNGAEGMNEALDALFATAEEAVHAGINIIILSDRMVGPDRVPIPALLATAGVHHHLIRRGLRTSVGLVVETGDAREVHHFCVLAGYGAEAINPYLAFDTLAAMARDLPNDVDAEEAIHRYIKAIDKGLLKVMAKMGISTYQSYCGAQIFDAIGLKSDFVARYFTGTATTIEGAGCAEIAAETVKRHRDAFGDSPVLAEFARSRRRLRLPFPRRTACLALRDRLDAAACGARQCARPVSRLRPAGEPGRGGAHHHPLPLPHQVGRGGRAPACGPRGGRAGQGDRQALRHRRHELRLDQPRGAHDARHRHEPHRRPLEHRRRRRGSRPLQAAGQRRFHALGDQAGRLGPLRRDRGVSGQLRHDADQDGAGCQARRRRPAARPQGRRDHRPRAPFDARRRPHLAAAAPRHLFDRGPGAAHLRPQERQPDRHGLGQARLRGRRRHGRRRRLQGARRSCHHIRL